MIKNLLGAGAVQAETDVLVVGAGTVGLVLAAKLAESGKRVLCLESGGWEQTEDTHPFNEVEQVATVYSGAKHGRFRALGGTSSRWGGALIPFQDADLKDAGWPVSGSDLAPYVADVEALFGLPAGAYESPELMSGGSTEHIARAAKWPAFRKRNVFTLLEALVRSDTGPEVWINATATDFQVNEGRISEVTARSASGDSICVKAQCVLLAAGAIESTRLLLLVDRQNGGLISRITPHLGQHFHDHLSAVVAELVVKDRAKINKLIGFGFGPGGTMRNIRFELAPNSSLRQSIRPCFAHIAFDDQSGSGFDALRDVYRALQRGRMPRASLIGRLAFDIPWLVQAAWWRFFYKRLHYPHAATLRCVMVIEQHPTRLNTVSLSAERKDLFGQPLASINWRIQPQDVRAMQQAASAFAASWEKSTLVSLAEMKLEPEECIHIAMQTNGGIYHPGGTTRMAAYAKGGVVDRNLCVFGISNLRVVATSVLPTGGGANPTMMLMLLAMRCIAQLSGQRLE